MNIGFEDFVFFFFLPLVYEKSEKNILVYSKRENKKTQVVIRRKTSKGFKTIILNERLLKIHYKEFLSDKKNRFNKTGYTVPW